MTNQKRARAGKADALPALIKSYNVATRIGYSLPRTTHRYFVEGITAFYHPKILLSSRFVRFHDSLVNFTKPVVHLLTKISRSDENTFFGSNMRKIVVECGVEAATLNPTTVKEAMNYFKCPDEEAWRIPLLLNLIDIRSNEKFLDK